LVKEESPVELPRARERSVFWGIGLVAAALPILGMAHSFVVWGSGRHGGENAGLICVELAAMAIGLVGYTAGVVLIVLGLRALYAYVVRSLMP
jgi:hypothetical protein